MLSVTKTHTHIGFDIRCLSCFGFQFQTIRHPKKTKNYDAVQKHNLLPRFVHEISEFTILKLQQIIF